MTGHVKGGMSSREVAPQRKGSSARRAPAKEVEVADTFVASAPPDLGAQPAKNPGTPESPYSWATTSAAPVLQEIPADDEASLLGELFLEGGSFPELRERFGQELADGLDALSGQGLDVDVAREILSAPSAATPRRLYQSLLTLSRESQTPNELLASLKEKAGLWQALEDFSKLKADGLMRTAEHYISPGHLALATAARGWDIDSQTGMPIADTVVIGGGPGGLATTYHLSEGGHRVVLLEGGKIGQGFADANAQSVHQLRTHADASNVIYTGSQTQLGVAVSMPRNLAQSRLKCEEARHQWSQATGEPEQGYTQAAPGERAVPANRAELFDHMAQVAAGLAQHYGDTFVSENSPVSQLDLVERDGAKLFSVQTENGHRMLARSLVMATGFVGSDGEYARCLKTFDRLPNTLVLCNDHDLYRQSAELRELQEGLDQGRLAGTMVMTERMLGRPELREMVKSLPAGSRVGVIGGGESAVKGALEVLALNAEIGLDLYTSSPIEPYQTQVPTSVIHPAVVEKSLSNAEVANRTWKETENFETPVTPATMASLLKAESEGRLRIRELGAHFSDKTVELAAQQNELGQTIALDLKDPAVMENLRRQRESWAKAGLYGKQPPADDPTRLPPTALFVVAAGYDRRSLQAGPMVQRLVDLGVAELKNGEPAFSSDGLTSSLCPTLAFNTAGASLQPADSAIPGRAVRGYRLSKNLAAKLPPREKPADRIPSKLPFGDVDTVTDREENLKSDDWVLAFLDQEGIPADQVAAREAEIAAIADPEAREKARKRWDIERRFPAINANLRQLLWKASEEPESLTPAEKVMVDRAYALSARAYHPKGDKNV